MVAPQRFCRGLDRGTPLTLRTYSTSVLRDRDPVGSNVKVTNVVASQRFCRGLDRGTPLTLRTYSTSVVRDRARSLVE